MNFLNLQSRSQSTSSEGEEASNSWIPTFVVITDKELRLYNSPPWSFDAWGNPFETWPLLTTRFVNTLIMIMISKNKHD